MLNPLTNQLKNKTFAKEKTKYLRKAETIFNSLDIHSYSYIHHHPGFSQK